MLSISLGTVALPVPPLMLLVVVWATAWLATVLHARSGPATSPDKNPQATSNAIFIAGGCALLGPGSRIWH